MGARAPFSHLRTPSRRIKTAAQPIYELHVIISNEIEPNAHSHGCQRLRLCRERERERQRLNMGNWIFAISREWRFHCHRFGWTKHELRRQHTIFRFCFYFCATDFPGFSSVALSRSLTLRGVAHQFINSHTKRTKNFRFSIVSIYGLCDLPKFKINGWIYFIHCCVLSSSGMCVGCVGIPEIFHSFFSLFIPIPTPFAECVYSLEWLSFMWYKWFIGCHLYHFYCHITQIACTSHSFAHNTTAQMSAWPQIFQRQARCETRSQHRSPSDSHHRRLKTSQNFVLHLCSCVCLVEHIRQRNNRNCHRRLFNTR